MAVEQVRALLTEAFPDAEVSVSMEGGHMTVEVVSAAFEGARSVKRQQQVYAPLSSLITEGTVHAVNIRALTPAEAQG